MKATFMGIEVGAAFFFTAAILIVAAEIATWGLARRAGLIEAATRVVWTKDRVLACVSMAVLSCAALFVGFFAFVASFVEQWQALWPIAVILAVAGLLGLATVPRFLFR
ncbi:MAG TPA: hypothetical protein VMV27_04485 [Candidatus Binataceae bacterium]|nr:hypothetical protein [Candidatus Binataceae bacterium]